MKNLKYILFAIFLLIPFGVSADTIYDIDMDINVDKNGTASVTEKWVVKADSGSEWYKQYYNLGNMEITDYKVTMDGKEMKSKDNWDVDASMSAKAGYYGINEVSEGVELCFGKSDYDKHTFTLTYNITNFVFTTSDSDVIYATLIGNGKLKGWNITVTGYYEFPDNLDVWGFGHKGLTYVADGKIEMTSDNQYELNNEYIVLLVKFPKGKFENLTSYEQFTKFDDVLTLAKKGSFKHNYDEKKETSIWSYIKFIFYILIFLVPVLIGIIANRSAGYGYKGNKTIDKKNTPMFRDIPCDKNIYYANALIDLNKFGYKEGNILGAMLLKWIKEDKIGFKNEKKGVFNKDTSSIDLTKDVTFDNPKEKEVFDLMRAASGDGILEAKEMEKYCRNHYEKFLNLLKSLKDDEVSKLKADNHISIRANKEECKQKNVMDDYIYEDSKKLFGLKLFLEEFSRIDTKEVMEVKIWDEYLMFAYLFGIADKVAKQLKNLYPDGLQINNRGDYLDYGTFFYINTLSTRSVSAASAARSAAESYSAGGGGFSSGGGGGGSFGGGGGFGGR